MLLQNSPFFQTDTHSSLHFPSIPEHSFHHHYAPHPSHRSHAHTPCSHHASHKHHHAPHHTEGKCVLDFYAGPSREERQRMQEKCIGKWMKRMSSPEECVDYMAQHEASNACSVTDLNAACAAVADIFSVGDAERLCHNLNRAHGTFWPSVLARLPPVIHD